MLPPFVWITCPLCKGERFLIWNQSHVTCPVCELDGAILTRYPKEPFSPGMMETVKRLLMEELSGQNLHSKK